MKLILVSMNSIEIFMKTNLEIIDSISSKLIPI